MTFYKDRDPGDEGPQAEPLGSKVFVPKAVTILEYLPEGTVRVNEAVTVDPDEASGLPLVRKPDDLMANEMLRELLKRANATSAEQATRINNLLRVIELMDKWLIGTTPDDILDEVDRALGRVPQKVKLVSGAMCALDGSGC